MLLVVFIFQEISPLSFGCLLSELLKQNSRNSDILSDKGKPERNKKQPEQSQLAISSFINILVDYYCALCFPVCLFMLLL